MEERVGRVREYGKIVKENGWKVEWVNTGSDFILYYCEAWKNENRIDQGWWKTLWMVEFLRGLFDVNLT